MKRSTETSRASAKKQRTIDNTLSKDDITDMVSTALDECSKQAVLAHDVYPHQPFDIRDFVKVVTRNFGWHNRLMSAKCGQLDTTLRLDNHDEALRRCEASEDEAAFQFNNYSPERVQVAVVNIVMRLLNCSDPTKEAIASLTLIGSRFGWRSFLLTYKGDIMQLELDEWPEDIMRHCRQILQKANDVLVSLENGQFVPRTQQELPELIPLKLMMKVSAFAGVGGIYVNARYVEVEFLHMKHGHPDRQRTELMLFRLFLHELAHHYGRTDADDVNLHSPMKMTLTKSMEGKYEGATPKGPERGCVSERCAFLCRPIFDGLRNIPECLKPLVEYIAGDGGMPKFPVDLRNITSIPKREDQTTGLDVRHIDFMHE